MGTSRASSVRQVGRLGDAITGVFCVNEPNAVGCLQTLEETELAGEIPFVGFDTNAAMLAALKQGKMAGIVLQDPVQIGYETINTALAHLQGTPVEKRVTTKHHLVTAANLESEELQPLLYPVQFSGAQFTPDGESFPFQPRLCCLMTADK